jgi:hypothetical protein
MLLLLLVLAVLAAITQKVSKAFHQLFRIWLA